jgi:hypothetical protein
MTSRRRIAFGVICLLWAGIVIGISFIEAPVKFRTPTLSRPVAFDVGRTVFQASQWAQAGLTLLAAAAALAARIPRRAVACLGAAAVTLLLQMAWIFPQLNARAETIIAGGVPSGPSHHALYGVLEVVKVLALVTAAVVALQRVPTTPVA